MQLFRLCTSSNRAELRRALVARMSQEQAFIAVLGICAFLTFDVLRGKGAESAVNLLIVLGIIAAVFLVVRALVP
jgi:hypothetical protein